MSATAPAAPGASLDAYLSRGRAEVEEALLRVLPAEGAVPADLVGAMRYSVLAGGKRLRPVLCLAAADACGEIAGPRDELANAAAALELFHTYSLIHDDLPCMDDDTLRRGKPTCHVVYGEATALLAGDTLQTLGFEVLARYPSGDEFAARRADAVLLLAEAIGVQGMAGGQALDLGAEGRRFQGDEARRMLLEVHAKKTGRLLRASLSLGALLSGARRETRATIDRYGDALGLVFQIADDLLDVTASSESLGKTAGKDVAQEKLTYPAVFGLGGAVAERERALGSALAAARELEAPGGILSALATYAAHRDR